MQQIVADDFVRLQVALPELELCVGEVGRVVSAWFHPNTAYEVEFASDEVICTRRVLLLQHQVSRQSA